ncbi:MAG: PAS domain-containing protein [Bacteroidetes bacterium]|nr:PAS domain-containing protein [Bacteroidota bacterium]
MSVVISNAPIVLFQVDKEGIFRFSDGKGLQSLGLLPGQVLGLSVYDVYKDFPEICQQIKNALKGQIIRDIVNVAGIFFEIQYNPILDKNGKVISIIGIALDITERKKIENALAESEQRFTTLFREMTEGVALHELVFDNEVPVNYRIIEVNPAYARQTGLDFNKSRNKLATELYGTEIPPYFKEFSNVALTGEKFTFETYFEPLERHFKISVVSPSKYRFATVFEDVTIQKNAKRN